MPILIPFGVTALSTASYAAVLTVTRILWPGATDRRPQIKAISSLHSAITTTATILALSTPWKLEQTPGVLKSDGSVLLDDSTNPLIVARSQMANAITAWETGYMIYDSAILFAIPSLQLKSSSPSFKCTTQAIRKNPIIFGHHMSLATALLVLQIYIAKGKERGMYIIAAFLLMNASNPLMHLRWWQRRRTGTSSMTLDAAFAASFVVSRFGLVWWVLSKYGRFHGLKPLEALAKQRLICRVGTTTLVGLNGIWFLMLLRSLFWQHMKLHRRSNQPYQ